MTTAFAASAALTDAPGWLAERSDGPAPAGSILVHAPSSAFQAPGGGEVQLLQTARHLERLGLPVRPFQPWADRLESGRLLHLFGMSREGLELARVAGARSVPVVLSPICWFEPSALASLAGGPGQAALALSKYALRRGLPRMPGWRRELLTLADRILPNSEAEGRQLVRLFACDPGKVRIVPNGVEPRFAQADPSPFRARFGDAEFTLYAGRIEPRKNPLGLIRAARRIGARLVLIGDPVPGHAAYARACRAEGDGLATWMPRLDHADPSLASAYAAARAFALPSWFETPGLAALEAALAGCAVVITPHGCTREYFGERARYARPDRPAEIAAALRLALDAGPAPGLRDHILNHYSWSDAARRTAEVYDELAR